MQPPPGVKEGLLGQFGGVLRAAGHAEGQIIDTLFVVGNQLAKGVRIASFGPFHQLLFGCHPRHLPFRAPFFTANPA